MANTDEKDTVPNLETILNAVNGLRQEIGDLRLEMNERFDKVEKRLTNVETRLANVETDVAKVKELQFVFENEIDRLLSLNYQALTLAHESRADIRIMRKEIASWSNEVRDLERKVA